MEIKTTSIKDLLVIENPVFADDRGFFTQLGRTEVINEKIGREFNIAQFNHSRSNKGVLRGVHYENMDKLVYVPNGKMIAIIVDLNPDSQNFGKYEQFELGEDNKVALFLPEGVGNSFYVLSDTADYIYLVSKKYNDTITRQIKWDDSDLNLPWPDKNPVISERDKTAQSLREAFPQKF
ncbi:MAG: dTDP-4-dehydrorhamnose 3,5-epimerase family protein [bacterium]